ncbi:MAG TPA: molybdopterin-synthase adenylyltransferase MoeB [Flavobacteriales bacterium]|jgi:adenylyltransferase/sulfurtransferase|nr:molybdopterin-synthase adenylyltransferase MoeB [Flavobacteriales bacterium]HIN41007.1 molybdopterin-synthase adenylyltransferase MoeB [Flavobacteriales bacterium]HIO15563.1 molybdopterin-synthase adenylyltransferase MoeB [Flavobacteriales bacterium]HIO58776.1 molybdopterin-synthase adenylyltransferase MoeB [Flavobacteriales bacterium]
MSHQDITFSKEELERYSRHLIIPEFNIEGQRKLKASSVLVIGSGGLGSPLLLYLAAAGVGRIGIVDFDTVDASNLQRQVLFGVEDVGVSKAVAAEKRLASLNPHITIEVHDTMFTVDNARELVKQYDVVADGTDNFPTRYLVNDTCVLEDKVNVYASIFRFEGQASVFNELLADGTRGPNYRDLFPSPPPPGLVPSCAEGGVIGVLPGILGSIQALEVLKVISGVGDTLSGRLFLFDATAFSTRILKIRKNKNNPLNGENPTQTELINYDQFCGIGVPSEQLREVEEITVLDYDQWRKDGREHVLIDVREPYEYGIAEMGGTLIPLATVLESTDRIPKDIPVVVQCRSGSRSATAIRELEDTHGYTNLINLKGGILEWQEAVQPMLARY